MTLVSDILEALQQPLRMLFDPTERVFWPCLLSAVVLTLVVMGLRPAMAALHRGLFARRIWAHASSRTDVSLLFVKAIGATVLRIPWLAVTMAAALEVALFLHGTVGPAPELSLSPLAITVIYTLVLLVAWDASRFVLHRWMHESTLLWQFHQVHHSAEVLTPLTLYRTHPVETALYELRGFVTTALVTGVFTWLFRGTAVEWQIVGVNALGFAFNFIGGNLRHSHVWLRFGALERWFLSPAQHQLHHGREIAEQNSNYGTWLAIWDRWIGTWRPAPQAPITRYGLDGGNHRFDSVVSVLVGPVREAASQLMHGRRRRLD